MALVFPVIDFIEAENKRNPIVGEVLFMGKQETFGRELTLRPEAHIRTLDWSPHFGADLVWDLGKPVPEELRNRFDFIYDGGSLDNMFNPAEGIMNMARMLRPMGRMVCLACSSAFSMPYTMFSPGWFYDYFEANNFDGWIVHLCKYHGEAELLRGPWSFYSTSDNLNRPAPLSQGDDWVILSLAQKGPASTSDVQPIQFQYRPTSQPPSSQQSAPREPSCQPQEPLQPLLDQLGGYSFDHCSGLAGPRALTSG